MVTVGAIRRNDACFRRAVSLQDRDTSREKGVGKCRRKWRPTGNEVSQPTSHSFAPLGKNQAIGDLLLQGQPRWYSLMFVFQFSVTLADRHGSGKNAEFPTFLRKPLLHYTVINLFKEAWYGRHNCWTYFSQILPDLIEGCCIVDRHTVVAKDIEARSLENVRKWKDGKGNIGGTNGQTVRYCQHIRDEVVMRQHHPLWLTRRARGVDDCR